MGEVELEFTFEAIFTEPEDQSAWWYVLWLIQFAKDRGFAIVADAVAKCRELLELEPESKCLYNHLYINKLSSMHHLS